MPNQPLDINATFKRNYATQIVRLFVEEMCTLRDVKFESSKKAGGGYQKSVLVRRPSGATNWAHNTDGGTFRQPKGAVYKPMLVEPTNFIFNAKILFEDWNRLQDSPKVAVEGLGKMVTDIKTAAVRELELQALHGSAISEVSETEKNDLSGTDVRLRISKASWAPGIYHGAEGMVIEFRLKSNPATLIGTTGNQEFEIVNVDFTTGDVTFRGTSAGATSLRSISGTHEIHLAGTYGAGMLGLKRQVSNTGVHFGLDAAVYSVMRGNTATLSETRISAGILSQRILHVLASRGASGKHICYVSDKTWEDFNQDTMAAAIQENKGKSDQFTFGNASMLVTSAKIQLLIKPNSYCWNGQAVVFKAADTARLGQTDLDYKPFSAAAGGGKGAAYFLSVPLEDGYYTQMYSNQQVVTWAPCHGALLNWTPDGVGA